MNRYLILYGSNNELVTFEADNVQHAVEQFCDSMANYSEPIGDKNVINEVLYCSPVHGWEHDEPQNLYACSNDGSWFGAADLSLVLVPASINDADEVEDFIVNHRGQD